MLKIINSDIQCPKYFSKSLTKLIHNILNPNVQKRYKLHGMVRFYKISMFLFLVL
jgi:hypothetical protein